MIGYSLFFSTLSKNLSDNNTNSPPIINPRVGNSHCMQPNSKDNSIDGESNDQKDAAIITPALKPKIVFNTFLFTCLKKQTTSDPNAVTPQVNIVAMKACIMGLKFSNQFNLIHLTIHNMSNYVLCYEICMLIFCIYNSKINITNVFVIEKD